MRVREKKGMGALHLQRVLPISIAKNTLFTRTPLSGFTATAKPLLLGLNLPSSQTATARTRAGWFLGLTSDNNKKKMNLPEIVKAGDPVLHEPAQEVEVTEIMSERVQRIIDDMIRVMRKAPGVGLAAPQIGIPLRVSFFLAAFLCFLSCPFSNFVPLSIVLSHTLTLAQLSSVNVYLCTTIITYYCY